MKKIFSTFASVLVLYGLGLVFAPETTANAANSLRARLDEAFAPNCEKAPVACLRQKQQDLKGVTNRLEKARGSLESESRAAAGAVAENRQLSAQNKLYSQIDLD